jgi:hypothetical protein
MAASGGHRVTGFLRRTIGGFLRVLDGKTDDGGAVGGLLGGRSRGGKSAINHPLDLRAGNPDVGKGPVVGARELFMELAASVQVRHRKDEPLSDDCRKRLAVPMQEFRQGFGGSRGGADMGVLLREILGVGLGPTVFVANGVHLNLP